MIFHTINWSFIFDRTVILFVTYCKYTDEEKLRYCVS